MVYNYAYSCYKFITIYLLDKQKIGLKQSPILKSIMCSVLVKRLT
jgi:hypothetical protein